MRWVMECCFCNEWGQGSPGEEPQQDGCGAGDGQIRPLALGLHTQVGLHLLEEPAPHWIRGDLQLPRQHKPFQDPDRVRRQVGAELSRVN